MALTLNKIGITTGNTVQAYHVTQSIDAFTGDEAYDITLSGSLTVTGSVIATSGFTGSLFGTASYATNAVSSSFTTTASYALTASFALNGGGGAAFPYTGSALITGSLGITGSLSNGSGNIASGIYSHAEGYNTQTGTQLAYDSGISSGIVTINSAYGDVSGNFFGNDTLLIYDQPFDNNYGKLTTQISQSLFDGINTIVELYDISITTTQAYVGDITQGILNWTGDQTIPGDYSHAEGSTTATGDYSHAEGIDTIAIGGYSHAEGTSTTATGDYSHAEGNTTTSTGDYSHAEGRKYNSNRKYSHAEGYGTTATGIIHTQKVDGTTATGDSSHAEGSNTAAIGLYSHAEGNKAIALGQASHAEGDQTIASGSYQHVQGLYNTQGDDSSLMIVGNGTSPSLRKDAFKVRMSGSIVLPTTQSIAPVWTGTDGEIIPATVGGQYRLYMWMAGAWRSSSFA
jgi:trimeric autotransporter adhesin